MPSSFGTAPIQKGENMTKILGVDFSHWQSKVDFSKLVANDIQFAIFKAGEIPTTSKKEYWDDMYERNIREAKEHSIISGAYYYWHPSIGASRQARHFIAIMDIYGKPDLPPVIDAEDTDGGMHPVDIAKQMKAFSDYLENAGYRKPIIYSRWGWLVNQAGFTKLPSADWYKDHYLWLAQYNDKLIYKPADMSKVIMWQYTDRLKLPGIGVGLDGNYWLKSAQELYDLADVDAQSEVEPEDPFHSAQYREKYLLFKRKDERSLMDYFYWKWVKGRERTQYGVEK